MSTTLSAVHSPRAKLRQVAALYLGLSGDQPLGPSARIGLGGIDGVVIGRGTARDIARGSLDGTAVVSIGLPDAQLSSRHARISRLGGAWVLEDLGSKNGTWVGGERITRRTLGHGDAILVGHSALVFAEHGGEHGDLDAPPAASAPGLATMSPELGSRFAELARAARSEVPIEIAGESGTGKELTARAVHTLSGRRGRFVAINCGALSASLLEGELFGHRRGAYTGASDDRAGLVRSAEAGTLFLDEVAELALPSQAALLRVLQEGEVVPLGADGPVKVDLRLVTATHRDLDAEVDAGRFRADLRARLLGVSITLPPLRDRREDLGLLIASLLPRLAPGRPVTFAADAVMALYTHPWRFNIRELERALAAAIAIAGDRIERRHFPPAIRDAADGPGGPEGAGDRGSPPLSTEDLALRDTLAAAIARHRGNLAAVARELGKDRTQIRRWMKRFELARDDG